MTPAFVHPNAIVETEEIGDGTRIWAFTHVLADARIGKNCNIGEHCFVESNVVVGDGVTIKNGNAIWEGVTLEDGVFVGPGVSFTNDLRPRSARLPDASGRYADKAWLVPTRVRRGATLGAASVIVAGVTIGEYAFVAAGAVVTRDVEPHALVIGVPARRRGWVCRCGGALPDEADPSCADCGTRYTLERGYPTPV